RRLIDTPVALVAFKCFFVALASVIIFRFRTRRFTEGSCWCVSAVYSMLVGVWWQYFSAPW
ncbi:hypothetical protein LCGC14_2101110, partial [marine sediment metagenome]